MVGTKSTYSGIDRLIVATGKAILERESERRIIEPFWNETSSKGFSNGRM